MSWSQAIATAQAARAARSPAGKDIAKIAGLSRARGTVVAGTRGSCSDGTMGVYEGTAPEFGYGYGAAGMVDPMLPGSFHLSSYDPHLYGADSHAELEGYNFGSFTDTIQSIIGGVANAATNVENIARGIANASQATQYVAGRAAASGGSIFQPTAADIAAQKLDVAQLLGGNYTTAFLIGGGVLLLFLMRKK